MAYKRVSIVFLSLAGPKFGSWNVFLAFVGAKMTKIDIQYPKLIVAND